jgi:general secretion pathway protein G
MKKMIKKHRRKRAAFTLVEVLLVLLILVALVAFVGLPLMNTQRDALKKNARVQIGGLEKSLSLYMLDLNQYPSTAQGLQALVVRPADLKNPAKWNGYLEKDVPLDPWNNPYQYAYPGQRNPGGFDVWSMGPDGVDGSGDEVGNWPEA